MSLCWYITCLIISLYVCHVVSDTDPCLLEKQEQQQPSYVALSYINRYRNRFPYRITAMTINCSNSAVSKWLQFTRIRQKKYFACKDLTPKSMCSSEVQQSQMSSGGLLKWIATVFGSRVFYCPGFIPVVFDMLLMQWF